MVRKLDERVCMLDERNEPCRCYRCNYNHRIKLGSMLNLKYKVMKSGNQVMFEFMKYMIIILLS